MKPPFYTVAGCECHFDAEFSQDDPSGTKCPAAGSEAATRQKRKSSRQAEASMQNKLETETAEIEDVLYDIDSKIPAAPWPPPTHMVTMP